MENRQVFEPLEAPKPVSNLDNDWLMALVLVGLPFIGSFAGHLVAEWLL